MSISQPLAIKAGNSVFINNGTCGDYTYYTKLNDLSKFAVNNKTRIINMIDKYEQERPTSTTIDNLIGKDGKGGFIEVLA